MVGADDSPFVGNVDGFVGSQPVYLAGRAFDHNASAWVGAAIEDDKPLLKLDDITILSKGHGWRASARDRGLYVN